MPPFQRPIHPDDRHLNNPVMVPPNICLHVSLNIYGCILTTLAEIIFFSFCRNEKNGIAVCSLDSLSEIKDIDDILFVITTKSEQNEQNIISTIEQTYSEINHFVFSPSESTIRCIWAHGIFSRLRL